MFVGIYFLKLMQTRQTHGFWDLVHFPGIPLPLRLYGAIASEMRQTHLAVVPTTGSANLFPVLIASSRIGSGGYTQPSAGPGSSYSAWCRHIPLLLGLSGIHPREQHWTPLVKNILSYIQILHFHPEEVQQRGMPKRTSWMSCLSWVEFYYLSYIT